MTRLPIYLTTFFSLFWLTLSVQAEDWPFYTEQTLHIPMVDSPEIPGAYQNVTLELTSDNGWQLTDYRNAYLLTYGNEPDTLKEIERVELIKTDSFPTQVFIRVSGNLWSLCGELGKIRTQRVDNTFNIYLFHKTEPTTCISAAGVTPYHQIIPLNVYDLEAGSYDYQVNNQHQGSFELSRDNRLELDSN